MTAVLTQDLKLLDILEALPSAEEPNSDALRARLTTLCAEQSMDVPEARIRAAVDHYLNHRTPVAHSSNEVTWARPTSKEEWQQAQAILHAHSDHFSTVESRWVIASLGALLMMGGSLVTAMILDLGFHIQTGPLPLLVCGLTVLSVLALGFMRPLYKLFKTFIWQRRPWMMRARADFEKWVGSDRINDIQVRQLEAASPDLDRLAQWLASVNATQQLRVISRGPVPVTQWDAQNLDAIARKEKESTHHHRQHQIWQDSLQQLASDDA